MPPDNRREWICLCVWCAIRSKRYWLDLWPFIDSAIKRAVADGLHQYAVAGAYASAVATAKIMSEFGPRREVPGAVARHEYQFRVTQHRLQYPESAIVWTSERLMGMVNGDAVIDAASVAIARVDGVDGGAGQPTILTRCERCDMMVVYRRHTRRSTAVNDTGTSVVEQEQGQSVELSTPDADGDADGVEVEIEKARDALQSIRDEITRMVMEDGDPERIGALQERANDYVGMIVALESMVHTPPEPLTDNDGTIGGNGNMTTATSARAKQPKGAPKAVVPKAPSAPKPPGHCWDGCGTSTPAGVRFVPGHDSKFKSILKQVERGNAKLTDQNSKFREIAATLPKCTKCSSPIWGGREKNEKAGIEAIPGGPGAPNALGPECAKKAKLQAQAPTPAPTSAHATQTLSG